MATLSLAVQQEIARAFAPTPKRERGLSLRDHVEGLQTLIDTVEGLDADDLTPELRESLECDLASLIAGTRAKVDRCNAALAHFEAAAEAAAKEEARLAARRKYFERAQGRLEMYVLAVLSASKLERLDGYTSSLVARRNPPSVVIDDEDAIPGDLFRVPPQPAAVPDKSAIKAAIKAGECVPGARLVRGERLVRQ